MAMSVLLDQFLLLLQLAFSGLLQILLVRVLRVFRVFKDPLTVLMVPKESKVFRDSKVLLVS